eukprot:3186841-Amphidinium_carterae.2
MGLYFGSDECPNGFHCPGWLRERWERVSGFVKLLYSHTGLTWEARTLQQRRSWSQWMSCRQRASSCLRLQLHQVLANRIFGLVARLGMGK